MAINYCPYRSNHFLVLFHIARHCCSTFTGRLEEAELQDPVRAAVHPPQAANASQLQPPPGHAKDLQLAELKALQVQCSYFSSGHDCSVFASQRCFVGSAVDVIIAYACHAVSAKVLVRQELMDLRLAAQCLQLDGQLL